MDRVRNKDPGPVEDRGQRPLQKPHPHYKPNPKQTLQSRQDLFKEQGEVVVQGLQLGEVALRNELNVKDTPV